jgi:hypothetical protein
MRERAREELRELATIDALLADKATGIESIGVSSSTKSWCQGEIPIPRVAALRAVFDEGTPLADGFSGEDRENSHRDHDGSPAIL